MPSKTHLTVVVIGHIDAGKSTIAGHLLYKCGGVDKRSMADLEKKCAEIGKASFKYAWVLDNLKAERERGITIDISTSQFETHKYSYTLIDTPGHRDFIKNMITGSIEADIALLCVDSSPGGFESGWVAEGQTREHVLLAFTTGVKQLVVAVNKMDCCDYAEQRFLDIKNEVANYIRKVGYKLDKVAFVPTSGYLGENLIEKSCNMSWHQGPTLFEALDKMDAPNRRSNQLPFRMPVRDVYKIGGIGTVAVGRVEVGTVNRGMKCCFGPTGRVAHVHSIEMHHQSLEKGLPGDVVSINCGRGVSVKEIKRGDVASDNANDPATGCSSFTAQIIIMSHPGEIQNGYCPVLHCGTASVATKLKNIDEKMDRRSGKSLETNPKFVKAGDACMVTLAPTKPIVVEEFASCPPLGRFAIRDMRQTVAVGVVKSVQKGKVCESQFRIKKQVPTNPKKAKPSSSLQKFGGKDVAPVPSNLVDRMALFAEKERELQRLKDEKEEEILKLRAELMDAKASKKDENSPSVRSPYSDNATVGASTLGLSSPAEKQGLPDETSSPYAPTVGASSLGSSSFGDQSTTSNASSHSRGMTARLVDVQDVKLGNQIGQGAFGKVFKGECAFQDVAVKVFEGGSNIPEAIAVEVRREVDIMCQLSHPNIVRLYGLVERVNSPPMLVMEYGANGSLYNFLRRVGAPVPWNQRLRIAYELSRGLAYLHMMNIIHRDIKSLNVILDHHCQAMWCDFGLASAKSHLSTNTNASTQGQDRDKVAGTLRWLAPEQFTRKYSTPSRASDVWSLGMVFFEIASGKVPFSESNNEAVIRGWIKDGEVEDVPDECEANAPVLAGLMKRCWLERSARPSAADITEEMKALF